jgi:hypothetical protein
MKESIDYSGKKLRLNDNVAYVQVEDKGVVMHMTKRQQFFPDSGAARMLLSLLSSEEGKEIHFEILKLFCTELYTIGEEQAGAALNTFLAELETHGLLKSIPAKKVELPPDVKSLLEGIRKEMTMKMAWPGANLYGGGKASSYTGYRWPWIPHY